MKTPTEPQTPNATTEPSTIEADAKTAAAIAQTNPIHTLTDLFSQVIFLPPAKPEPFTFDNGTKRTPLADVLFDLGGTGLLLAGAQIIDEQNPKRGRSIQLRMPNKGKAGGYDPLFVAESEREKAEFVNWHKTIVAKWADWRREQVKKGATVRPSEIKADAVVFSDLDLADLGLLDTTITTTK